MSLSRYLGLQQPSPSPLSTGPVKTQDRIQEVRSMPIRFGLIVLAHGLVTPAIGAAAKTALGL